MEHIVCNLCGKDETRKMFVKYGLQVVRCKSCTLVYVNPRMTAEELVKIYNEHYYSNPDFFTEKELGHFGYDNYFNDKENIQMNFLRRIQRLNKLYPQKGKLLDIGCAAGFLLDLARKEGWEVAGVDLSKEAIAFAQKELKLDALESTLKDAQFKGNSFDAVTFIDVIEHLPDPKSELLEIHRVLKPGGVVMITTPNESALVARLLGRSWAEYKRVREHIYFFSNKTLHTMLRDTGFKVVRTETTGRIFTLKGWLEMLQVMHPVFGLLKPLGHTFLGRIKFTFNPGYKTTVYAVKA